MAKESFWKKYMWGTPRSRQANRLLLWASLIWFMSMITVMVGYNMGLAGNIPEEITFNIIAHMPNGTEVPL